MENINYDTFIKNSDYKGLLEYTNQVLEQDKGNKTALETKAKALIALREYEKAYEILKKISIRANLFSLEKITYSLISFNSEYKKHLEDIKLISETWYKERMLWEIEKFQKIFIQNNKEYKNDKFDNNLPEEPARYYYNNQINKTFVELHKYALGMKAPSYILGPNEKVVNNYKIGLFDVCIRYNLESDLIFPYTQGNSEGWVFTKEQNYVLPYGHIYLGKHRYIESGPVCIAPFPVTQWDIDSDKYIQP
jgi:hypothetical protein